MKRIGFIGLGLMGSGMSMNILKAGFPLTVWNRTVSRTEPLAKAGAKVAKTPKEVAENSDIVIDIVTDSKDVEEVLLGAKRRNPWSEARDNCHRYEHYKPH